jgi:hypothetical protein
MPVTVALLIEVEEELGSPNLPAVARSTLPLGVAATLDADAGTVTIDESALRPPG